MNREKGKGRIKPGNLFYIAGGLLLAVGMFSMYYFNLSENAHINIQKAKLWTGYFDADKREMALHDDDLLINSNYDLILQTPDGEKLYLEKFKGKVLFVNLWASWCAPCIAEMPTIEKLYQTFSAEDEIEFLLLSLDEDPQMAINFMNERNLEMPFYFLNSELPEALHYSFIPTTFVISAEGKVIYKNEGMADYNSLKFKKWLKEKVG